MAPRVLIIDVLARLSVCLCVSLPVYVVGGGCNLVSAVWYFQGFITSHVEKHGSIDAHLLWRAMMDVAKGLFYLHTKQPAPIVHRDLKEDNLLVYITETNDLFIIKIADVGLSRVRCLWRALISRHSRVRFW